MERGMDKRVLAGIVIIALMVLPIVVNAVVKPRPSPLSRLISRFIPSNLEELKSFEAMEGRTILSKNITGKVRKLHISAESSVVTIKVAEGRATSVIAKSKEVGGEASASLSKDGVLEISAEDCGVLIYVSPGPLENIEITADSSVVGVKLNNLSSDLKVTADSSVVNIHAYYVSGNSIIELNADSSFVNGKIYVPVGDVAVNASASDSMIKVTAPSGELTIMGGGSRSLGAASPGAFLISIDSSDSMVNLEITKVSP